MNKNFLFPRVERDVVQNSLILVVESKHLDLSDERIFSEIRKAVAKWASETENGKQAFSYAQDDMNIGDIDNNDYWKEIVERCPFIDSITILDVDINKNMDWDTILIDEMSDD